ncbi:LEAF RUST 10 DISEASE-RESISTANCE LOCUS RECEPTOR-LIKE PROTEIN KINASE-like 2.1 [Linum perenne]
MEAPSSLLLLLLLHLIILNQSQSRSLPNLCTSTCGHLTNITYPFRLTTDPPTCGDSDYQITCLNNTTPLFRFHSSTYFVRRIFHDRRVIRLVDPNFFPNQSCSLPSQSLSVADLTQDPRFAAYAYNTDTSFVRCSGNLTGQQSYRRLPCLGNDDGGAGGSSVYVSYGTYIISGLNGTCSFLSRVPTIYQPILNPSYESVVLLLQEGFDLAWSVECRDCLARGSECFLTDFDPTPSTYQCRSPEDYLPAVVSAIISSLSGLFLVINLIVRFILAPIVIIGFLIHKYRTSQKSSAVEIKAKIVSNRGSSLPRRYSYSDIEVMTEQFKHKLGRGMFKGKLPENGGLVAVKMLGDHFNLSSESLMNEISTIAGVRHDNVVRLLGFCCEGSRSCLVYEYMPNGSLDKYICARGEAKLLLPISWEQLDRIALGTARGIHHLHEVSILHLDIKPQNVVLDHDFVPKVADVGMAKLCRKGNDSSTTGANLRYIAPEVLSDDIEAVSSKSDVYSFGMLLLEMVEGKRIAESKGKNHSSDIYFPMWVHDHLSEGGDLELQNVTEIESAIAKKLSIVGLCCIQKSVSDRPSMARVVEMLMGGNADDLQLPRNSLCFPEHDSGSKDVSSDSFRRLLPQSVEPSS